MRQLPSRSEVLIFVVLLAITGKMWAADSDSLSQTGRSSAARYLYDAANQERASKGLPLLQWDSSLLRAAENHAEQMAEHSDLSHQFANERDLGDRGAAAGAQFSSISENVAEAADTFTIHDLWMHSPDHRANLLDPKTNSVGIAVVTWRGQLYAVEDFSTKFEKLSLAEEERVVRDSLADSGLTVLVGDDARQMCSMPRVSYGARRASYVMHYTSTSLEKVPEEIRLRLESGRYRMASVGACQPESNGPFALYAIAIALYP